MYISLTWRLKKLSQNQAHSKTETDIIFVVYSDCWRLICLNFEEIFCSLQFSILLLLLLPDFAVVFIFEKKFFRWQKTLSNSTQLNRKNTQAKAQNKLNQILNKLYTHFSIRIISPNFASEKMPKKNKNTKLIA